MCEFEDCQSGFGGYDMVVDDDQAQHTKHTMPGAYGAMPPAEEKQGQMNCMRIIGGFRVVDVNQTEHQARSAPRVQRHGACNSAHEGSA